MAGKEKLELENSPQFVRRRYGDVLKVQRETYDFPFMDKSLTKI